MINLKQATELPSKVRTYYIARALSILFSVSLPFLIAGASIWFGVFLVLEGFIGLPFVIYIYLNYQNSFFVVDDEKVTISHGVVAKHSKTIPFSRVQNVRIVSGLARQMFDIASVEIWTASVGQAGASLEHADQGMFKHPDGYLLLDVKDAQWLKDFIVSRLTPRESVKNHR